MEKLEEKHGLEMEEVEVEVVKGREVVKKGAGRKGASTKDEEKADDGLPLGFNLENIGYYSIARSTSEGW